MPLRKEIRIVLPLTVDEYQIAQLYAVAEASKDVTGGGDGVEVLKNEPYTNTETGEKGQYTYKIYHFKSKVPAFIRLLAPEGSLEAHEEAWNAYPYCKTVITNPGYMKKKFELRIETWHKPDKGELENVHNLTPKELESREVVRINIADPVSRGDYKEDEDPALFHSVKTGRGPLKANWMEDTNTPFMCCYKLITVEFKWLGLQTRMESFIQRQEKRFFTLLHRQLFCWLDKYHGMTMDDIRAIEEKTKAELDVVRGRGQPRGFSAADDKKSDKDDNENDDVDDAGSKAISK